MGGHPLRHQLMIEHSPGALDLALHAQVRGPKSEHGRGARAVACRTASPCSGRMLNPPWTPSTPLRRR